jgi:uncharacterized protein (DUF885 family)
MPSKLRTAIAIVFTMLFFLPLMSFAKDTPKDLESRRKQLNELLKEQWDYTMRTNPDYASYLGDKRWNDKWSDSSEEFALKDVEEAKKFLAQFQAVDTTGFPEQEALNKTLMVRDLKDKIEGAKFQPWLIPVNQFFGVHIDLPQYAGLFSFTSVKDYEDYNTRLRTLPKIFDDTLANMRKGMALGLMQPKFLLEKVTTQAEGIGNQKPEDSPYALPFRHFPKDISEADQKRLRDAGLAAIRDQVNPVYLKFAKFVKEEYAPKGRMQEGLWSIPQGAERYAFAVKTSTTTTKTPEQIHQIGLAQVKEIEGRMMEIAKKQGYSDLKSFNKHVMENKDLYAHSREEILNLYRKYTDQMYAKLPELFGRLPKAKVVVEPVEAFREKEAGGAQYFSAAQDGSRPGRVVVNTYDPEKRQTISMESTAYHEGVPGHHMQGAIAQELPVLPPFRQNAFYTAFGEGWALYSERLGKEVGFYQNPYNDYGRLQDEMLRAIRLVVDTGVHYKKWNREQMVQFFKDHSAMEDVNIQPETDRYIAWPAQALAYKMGQLKILELREKAQKALGAKFDIKAFHDEVLGAGALPLDVLEQRIDNWISAQKNAK